MFVRCQTRPENHVTTHLSPKNIAIYREAIHKVVWLRDIEWIWLFRILRQVNLSLLVLDKIECSNAGRGNTSQRYGDL